MSLNNNQNPATFEHLSNVACTVLEVNGQKNKDHYVAAIQDQFFYLEKITGTRDVLIADVRSGQNMLKKLARKIKHLENAGFNVGATKKHEETVHSFLFKEEFR